MNAAESSALWARLRAAGIACGDVPAAGEDTSPWYVRAMIGIAAWIAAVFLIAAVLAAVSRLFRSGGAMAVMGLVLCAIALAMLRAVEGGGWRWWVLYGASACLALYSHYTAVFVVVAEGLWALWAHRERMRPLLYTQAAIIAGYLPWVPGFLEQRKDKIGVEVISAVAPVPASAA